MTKSENKTVVDLMIEKLEMLKDEIAEKDSNIEALIAGQKTLQRYIAEQEAEIEMLQQKIFYAKNCINELEYAYKKTGHSNSRVDYVLEEYNNLVKEMVGDSE